MLLSEHNVWIFACSLQEVQNMKTVEELEQFMLNHGEKIIDALGAEVDRIEKLLKVILFILNISMVNVMQTVVTLLTHPPSVVVCLGSVLFKAGKHPSFAKSTSYCFLISHGVLV